MNPRSGPPMIESTVIDVHANVYATDTPDGISTHRRPSARRG